MPKAPAKSTTAVPQAQAAPTLPPAPEGMINVFVDGTLTHVKKGSTVKQAAEAAGKEIPHFCYHERLSVAGNCRMCLVEVEGMPKPVASCHWPTAEGMKIRTDSPMATTARKGTMELLLINHPLDCPICDQGGECTLQDLSVAYGGDRTHYAEEKRAVDDKNIGSKIKTVMTRCIHCTRCIRFATEIAGVEEMGATGRGENMQVGTYVEQALQSELAGNMIDLCPVGALTNKPFAFTARPWEMEGVNSLDVVTDSLGSNLQADVRAGKVLRVVPRECDAVNEEWLNDAARFSVDALTSGRLAAPLVRQGKKLVPTSWPSAFAHLKVALQGLEPSAIIGLAEPTHSAEDLYSFKAFLTQTLGSTQLDARPLGLTLTKGMPHRLAVPLKAIENAGAAVLIGTNPRLEAPLLNLRLRRLALKKKAPIFTIAQSADLTYPTQNLGNTAEALEKLIASRSGVMEILKNIQNPFILVGEGALTRPDGLTILALAGKLAAKLGVEVSVLPSAAGSVDVMNLEIYNPKTTTASLIAGLKKDKTKVAFIYGDSALTPADIAATNATTVYIGTHLTEVAKACTLVLPSAAWSEKAGLYTNAEGRTQEAQAATLPPLQAKEDWKIFRALSEELGQKLSFDTLATLREKLAETNPAYALQNRGKITPIGTQTPPAGTTSSKPLASYLTASSFYLQNSYLNMSETMHKIAQETGTVKLKKAM